jgi:hypothetical protein
VWPTTEERAAEPATIAAGRTQAAHVPDGGGRRDDRASEQDFVPIWMRPPSWLYLPHQLQPAGEQGAAGQDLRVCQVADEGMVDACTIRGRTHSPGAHAVTPLERARARLAGRNAHLERSLNDHAERVAKRRAHCITSEAAATPAERIAAIRRRVAAKSGGGAASSGRRSIDSPRSQGDLGQCGADSGRCDDAGHQGGRGDEARLRGGDAVERDARHWLEIRRQGAESALSSTQRCGALDGGCGVHAGHTGNAEAGCVVDTPEAGASGGVRSAAKSKEDYKIHQALHGGGIHDAAACQAGYGDVGSGSAGEIVEGGGGGYQRRSVVEDSERVGVFAPPPAASAAAASRVAWHSGFRHGAVDGAFRG